MWRGRRCFILGGGPSLSHANLNALKDELTIGINQAFRHAPTVTYAHDLRSMQLMYDDPAWKSYQGSTLWLYSGQRQYRSAFQGVQLVRESKKTGMPVWSRSLADGIYRGTNAGVAALNLAEILGADPIYLIGYDFAGSGGATTNWHKNYPAAWKQGEGVYWRYVQEFERLHKMGVIKARVVNLNTDSNLRCFEMEVPAEIDALRIREAAKRRTPKARPAGATPAAVIAPRGLGDTVYMRPAIIKMLERHAPLYVGTPWPQLFWDQPDIHPVRPDAGSIRTAKINMAQVDPGLWCCSPRNVKRYSYRNYKEALARGVTPLTSFMGDLRVVDPVRFAMPVDPSWAPPWVADLPRPFGVVRPSTLRIEYKNISRNPNPGYLQTVIDAAPQVHWISVGSIDGKAERAVEKPMERVSRYENGELSVTQLIGLMAAADVVVCGPSSSLPIGAAVGTPTFCVFGGSVPPQCLIDARMGPKMGFAAPAPFCACFGFDHGCRKEIPESTLIDTFERFLALHGVKGK